MAPENNKKVLIIGAGLAGLVVAHACQTQNIPYEVYERDESPDSRDQGFSITLHMGLKAIKEFVTYPGAFDDFGKKISVNPLDPNGISMAMLNGLTEEVYFESGDIKNSDSHRVNRKRFRSWLLEGLDQTKIHWNKRISHYDSQQNDSVTAYFTDGSSATGDLLVGADGVLSPVCIQLLGGKEKYDEVTSINPARCFAGIRWVTKEKWAEFEKYSHCVGIVFGQDQNGEQTNMFYSINDIDESREDSIQVLWYVSRYDKDNKIPAKFESNEALLETLKQWTKDSFKDNTAFQNLILDLNPEETKVLQITIRERKPIPEILSKDERVVLVGDAVHCMTMFRGEGGNHAMLDAYTLGTQLGLYYSGKKTLKEVNKDYYAEVVPRGSKAVDDSHEAVEIFLVHRERMEALLQELNLRMKGKYK